MRSFFNSLHSVSYENAKRRFSATVFFNLIIFFVSLFLRLFVRCIDPSISRDGCLYIQMAQLWAQGNNGYLESLKINSMGAPPLLLFIMASLIHLGISAETSGIGLNIITGALCPCLVYGIANEVIPRHKKIAISASILTSVNPSMVALSIEPQRDMIYLFFSGCLCLLLLKALRLKKWRYWYLAGVIFALSTLTRYETLEFIVIIVFAFLFCFVKKIISLKDAFTYSLLFLIGTTVSMFFFLYLFGSADLIRDSYTISFRKVLAAESGHKLLK